MVCFSVMPIPFFGELDMIEQSQNIAQGKDWEFMTLYNDFNVISPKQSFQYKNN
jgi:hypothetical protein